jgi:hypothetical protein
MNIQAKNLLILVPESPYGIAENRSPVPEDAVSVEKFFFPSEYHCGFISS